MTPAWAVPYFEALSRSFEDVATRRVMADLYLEANDQRGDFISMILKGSPSATIEKRLTKLFKRHRSEWLGPLEEVIEPRAPDDSQWPRFDGSSPNQTEVWDRGFPARIACFLEGSTTGAPEWATIREIELMPSISHDVLPLELSHPMTANVRRIELVSRRGDAIWVERVREYLRNLGRGALLNAPTLWRYDESML